jgi:hypothetical protein
MNNPIVALELINFAPLIQFVAGVYLVCLYQDVFDKLPVTGRIEKLIKQTYDFKNQYFFGGSIHNLGLELSSLWQDELKKIRRIFIVSASFCIFLLGYIGCHHYNDNYKLDFNLGLIVVGGVVFIYTVWCFFSRKQNKFFLPFFWIAAYLLLFHFSRLIVSGLSFFIPISGEISTNLMTVFMVKIVMVLGFIVLGIKSFEYHRKLRNFETVFSTMTKDIKIILDFKVAKINKLREASDHAKNLMLEEIGSQSPNYDAAIDIYVQEKSKIVKKRLKL